MNALFGGRVMATKIWKEGTKDAEYLVFLWLLLSRLRALGRAGCFHASGDSAIPSGRFVDSANSAILEFAEVRRCFSLSFPLGWTLQGERDAALQELARLSEAWKADKVEAEASSASLVPEQEPSWLIEVNTEAMELQRQLAASEAAFNTIKVRQKEECLSGRGGG